VEKEIIDLIEKLLNLQGRSKSFTGDTKLLGSLPGLDSLAVAQLLTKIESVYKIRIEDDEVDRSIFLTVATLTQFVSQKVDHAKANQKT
jgi:acyl carrier protein